MGKYDHYEELEEEAYRDSVKPKRKPKKQKKRFAKNKKSRTFDIFNAIDSVLIIITSN